MNDMNGMSRPRARMADGVDCAAFALMCAMTNWAQPNPSEQEQQDHWWGLSPELRGQYRKWAHVVLDAHHCACAHDMCPTGLDGIALQHARLLDRLERSRAPADATRRLLIVVDIDADLNRARTIALEYADPETMAAASDATKLKSNGGLAINFNRYNELKADSIVSGTVTIGD